MNILIVAPIGSDGDTLDQDAMRVLKSYMVQFDSELTITERNIGHGADWPVLLATFGGVFFLGEQIQKNLEAWISLAKRFGQLFNWLKEKYGLARVDESGGLVIAINDIVSSSSGKSINSLQLDGIQTLCFTAVPWNPSDRLDGKPDALYIIALRVNNEEIFVYGVKSNGVIDFKHNYSLHWSDF